MTYNTSKIGDKQPDRDGNITISLDDLGGVDTVPVGEGLVYDETAGTWGPASFGGGTPGFNFVLFGQGESNNYANCGYAPTDGNTFCFYDSNPINTMEELVTFNYVGATSWAESITFAPGSYEVFIQIEVVFSGSGRVGIQLKDSLGNALTNINLIGNAQTAYGHPTAIMANLTFTETTTVHAEIAVPLGVSTNQGNTPSEYNVILIRSL